MTRIRSPTPAVHMRSDRTAPGADGAVLRLPLCIIGGWQMTDKWKDVTCKVCLKRGLSAHAPCRRRRPSVVASS